MPELEHEAPLSRRVASLEPYAILEVVRVVQETRNSGQDVISLAMGEPDYGAPAAARTAAVDAISSDRTRYTPMDGLPELRLAVRQELLRTRELTFSSDEVAITAGGTQVLFNSLLALVEDGDEVIVIAPYFPAYWSAIRFAGGTPVVATSSSETGFALPLAAIERALTARTRCIILNSPGNPTGAVYSAADLQRLASLIEDNPRLWIISDDIYDSLVFDGRAFPNIVQVEPRLRSRTILLNGLSKSFGMTGWRIGYAAGPVRLIEAMTQIAAISSFAPNTIGQVAAIAALNAPIREHDAIRKRYQSRRDRLLFLLAEAPGVTCAVPQGAFYAFPNCCRLLGRRTPKGELLNTDMDLALHLVRTHGIATVPGSAFGSPGHLRISFGASDAVVEEGVKRIVSACTAIMSDEEKAA